MDPSRGHKVPSDYGELADLLRSRLPNFAAGQRRIARLLLSDAEGTAFRSISETARLAEVHESSLVRFAGALGLAGYPALVELCRSQLSEQAQLVRRFEEAREHSEPGDLLAAAAEHDQRNVARTFANVDEREWERAVDSLTHGHRVHVMGLRKCFTVAYLLTYLLHLVRPGVRQLGAGSGQLVDELRDLAPDEVFVAVSIHRYTADTVRGLAHAKHHGLRTIVLTDNPASPLVEHADVRLYCETSGVTIMRSLTAFTALTQALATAVGVRAGTRSRAELRSDEDLLESFDVYFAD